MAETITPDLTIFSLANDNTGGTWVGASGAYDNQVNWQGTACWFYQTPKNGLGNGNFTPTSAVDMSATDDHLFWAMRCDVMTFCEPKTTGTAARSGLCVRVSSSGGSVEWHIAGSDTWGGEWKQFVLDLNNTSEIYATIGTLDLSAVTAIEWITDNSNSGTIRIVDNTMLDAVRFGRGLVITGTDWDLTDVAVADELKTNKWGVLRIVDENIHCQGRITSGNGATTTTFNSTDEEIVYSDNLVSSTLYEFNIVGSGNTSVLKGFSIKAAGAARVKFDASDATADLTISGSALKRAGLVNFASTSDVQSSTFNNCLQIDPSTGIWKNNTVTNSTVTDGACLHPSDDGNWSDNHFEDNLNAVEYDVNSDSTSPTLLNTTFTNNTNDYNNTSGASVELALVGTSNGSTYNSGGDIVTFPNSVTLTYEVETESGTPIEFARINIVRSDTKVELYQIETNSSGIATQSHEYTGNLDIEGWVRQKDIIGDDYHPKDFSGTITNTGFLITIKLIKMD